MNALSSIVPLQAIQDSFTEQYNYKLYVLRTDLNHPQISGNKLYKLKHNIAEALKNNKDTLLTFGGAFSNHIAATAAAGKEYGLKTIGIIRGEESANLNPTLTLAKQYGMELHFISRNDYRNKNTLPLPYTIKQENAYIIPEGGANLQGLKGCMEITESIVLPFDYICTPCGTGTTLAGISLSLNKNQTAVGFQVLKGENYICDAITKQIQEFTQNEEVNKNFKIYEDYHFGGYAKRTDKLIEFIHNFEQKHQIPLDYVYTGKMMFGIYDLMSKKQFPQGAIIIAVHTGGIQGNEGFEYMDSLNKIK